MVSFAHPVSTITWLLRALLLSQILCRVQAASAKNVCASLNTNPDYDYDQSDFQSEGHCSSTCKGYAYGILQGKACWCSNYAPAQTVSDSKCSDSCPGYPDDTCGNSDDDLYYYVSLAKASGTISSSADITKSKSSISSTASSTSTTAATTSISGTSSDAALQSESGGGSKSKSLSGGAIAGVVVGSAAAVVICLGVFAALWFRRRKANQNAQTENSVFGAKPPPPPSPGPGEFFGPVGFVPHGIPPAIPPQSMGYTNSLGGNAYRQNIASPREDHTRPLRIVNPGNNF